MIVIPGSKHQRKNVKAKLEARKIPLRVVGSEKMGFRLAGQLDDRIIPVGQTHKKQMDAIQVGYKKYGTKAIKLTDSIHRRKTATIAVASLLAVAGV